MNKTYWWRVGILSFSSFIFGLGYIVTETESLDGWYNAYTDPSMFLALAFIIISASLFFVDDSIFLKWLRFALVWLVITIIFIILAPEYQGGWLGIGPEKESVSFWMSVLFVVFSLGKLVWERYTIRKIQSI